MLAPRLCVIVDKVLDELEMHHASSCPFVEVLGDYNDNLNTLLWYTKSALKLMLLAACYFQPAQVCSN